VSIVVDLVESNYEMLYGKASHCSLSDSIIP
jgi:hypothetical protein